MLTSNRPGISFRTSDSISAIAARSTVIVAIGASRTLVGFAGEPEPRWIINTEFYHPDRPNFIYSYLSIVELLKNQETRSFGSDAVSFFVEQMFLRYLLVNPDTVKIVVLESMTIVQRFKQTLAEILFRRFKSPTLEFLPSQPLAIVPLNKSSALIIDVGYSETVIVPVVNNTTLAHAMVSRSIGSRSIHLRIVEQLKSYPCILPENYILEDGIDSDPDAQPLTHVLDDIILEDMCRQLCFVAPQNMQLGDGYQYVPYIDRFGRLYRINKSVRSSAADALFNQSDVETPTLAESILHSLLICAVDLRIKLAHKLLLIGGTTLMRGFFPRLMQEMEYQLSTNSHFEPLRALSGHFEIIQSVEFYHPHLPWIGGSIDSMIEGAHASNQIQLSEFVSKKKPLPDWTSLTAQ